MVIGGPEECAAELARLADAVGFRRLVCRVQWMGVEQRLGYAAGDGDHPLVMASFTRHEEATRLLHRRDDDVGRGALEEVLHVGDRAEQAVADDLRRLAGVVG